jgi:hypothetical protein
MRGLVLAALFLLALPASGAEAVLASPSFNDLNSRLSLYEKEGGATCSHFMADVVPWERRAGDWRDARGNLHGNSAFDTATVGAAGASWNVTELVKAWAKAGNSKGMFFLRATGGSGYASFSSRESGRPGDWPMLVIEYRDGRKEMIKPSADVNIDCSTYRTLGKQEVLQISNQVNALLEFPLPSALSGQAPSRALLVLSNAKGVASPIQIGVFELAMPTFPVSPGRAGLAANFTADRGVEKHPDVLFATGFDEGSAWKTRWNVAKGEIDTVERDEKFGFKSLSGSALKINLRKGSNFGSDLRLDTKKFGQEPDNLHFRYYVRLASDWNPTLDGGKMPGMAGTYNTAGWGGRRSNGNDGWSARGGFLRIFNDDHPMRGLTQLLTYVYHVDMKDSYGDVWIWPGALLERNRWYCIEQQISLNRPDAADGVLRVWIDGRMTLERKNLRFRTVDRLHIEDVWLNVYHGGVDPSPHDQHLYIDNVVVARQYIGPMAQ